LERFDAVNTHQQRLEAAEIAGCGLDIEGADEVGGLEIITQNLGVD